MPARTSTRRYASAPTDFCSRTRLPERLLDAVRVVAADEALLAPSIARRLIEQSARAAQPELGAVPEALAELTARELRS